VLIKKAPKNQELPDVRSDITDSVSPALSPVVSNTQNTQKYVSENRNFELNFPASWGEVNITKKDVEGGQATLFSFKTTDPKFPDGTVTAVTIYEYPSSSESKLGIPLTSNESYSYSYLTWEQAPSDHQQITEKELANVLKTFKLTK